MKKSRIMYWNIWGESQQSVYCTGKAEMWDNREGKFCNNYGRWKTYQIDYCNLDVIISVGYYVKSKCGTQFGIWAFYILKEYMGQGFALNGEQLKNLSGGGYFLCHL